MAVAYEKTEPTGSSTHSAYDVITNNCASFLINMAVEMNVKIDSNVVSFAVRRLIQQSGKDLASRIRGSINYLSLIGQGGGRNLKGVSALSDEGLVRLLVKKTAAGLKL